MSIDRCLFLKQASYYSTALLFGCKLPRSSASYLKVSSVDPNIPKRVEWAVLSPAKKKAFMDAVLCMKATKIDVPASFGQGGARKLDLWTAQAEVHQWYCSHRNGNFLPWHRRYLYHFELSLRQKIGEDFRLPYWNWVKNQEIPKELQDPDFVNALGITRASNTIAVAGKARAQLTTEWWANSAAVVLRNSRDYDTFGGDRGNNATSGVIESPYHNMVPLHRGLRTGSPPDLYSVNIKRVEKFYDERIDH
jgi:hypothetical protein